jgi:sulfoxide reductase heme-binding subunit YedZ
MIRRLGGRAWNRLHKLVYATGVLVVVHYWWLVKADVSRPAAYGVVVALLLGSRLYWARARTARATQPAPVGKPLSTLQRTR